MVINNLKREAGFSIVQGIILSGVLAWFGLVGTKYVTIQKDILKAAETTDQIEQVHNMIFTVLQNKFHCLTTMSASGVYTVNPGDEIDLASINIEGNPQPVYVTDTTVGPGAVRYMNGNIQIQKMTLNLPPDLAQPADLRVEYSRMDNGRKGVGGKNIAKTIKIVLQRLDATTLSGCYSVTQDVSGLIASEDLQQDVCEEFNIMEWDDTLKVCKMKNNLCPDGVLFAGIDVDGNVICRQMKEFLPYLMDPTFTQSCPDDYETVKLSRAPRATPTSPALLSVECNKTGVTCPSVQPRYWQINTISNVGANVTTICGQYLPRSLVGAVVTIVPDIPSVGQATYVCNVGGWSGIQPGYTCTAPCAPDPTVYWSENGNDCVGPAPGGNNGDQISVVDGTGPGTGNATFRCNYGDWDVQNGATCNN